MNRVAMSEQKGSALTNCLPVAVLTDICSQFSEGFHGALMHYLFLT